MMIHQATQFEGWTRVQSFYKHPDGRKFDGDLFRNILTGAYAVERNGSLMGCPAPASFGSFR